VRNRFPREEMYRVKFWKAVASGNDFIIIDKDMHQKVIRGLGYRKLALMLCKRRFGIGADGLLITRVYGEGEWGMRIFNSDGSEAQMCGNGIRCLALWASLRSKVKEIRIRTRSGLVYAQVRTKGRVKIKMPQAKNMQLHIPLKIGKEEIEGNYVEVGVPHTVIFRKKLTDIDLQKLGKAVRFHQHFRPEGTNVDFVKVLDKRSLEIRTYERGVEAETFSCGTGSVASALLAFRLSLVKEKEIDLRTQGGKVKVYLDEKGEETYLEGEARIVYEGEGEI